MCRLALASPSGCNPPAIAVQVQLLPDTLIDGLVAQPAEHLSLKQGAVVRPPPGPLRHKLAVAIGVTLSVYGQVVEWQTRGLQKAVPTEA